MALATNGTVRLARGLASSMKTVPSLTAYCTLMSAEDAEGAGQARVWSSMTAMTSAGRVGGGMAQAESPECTPASSMCSMTPPMRTSPARVAHGVDVDLGGVLQEPVDEDGPFGRQCRPAPSTEAARAAMAARSASSA